MSLKNRLSKMKNFLFDEEEVKEEKKETKKDRKKQKKEIEEAFNSNDDVETISLDDDFTYEFENDYTNDTVTDIDIPVTKSRVEKQEFTIPELTDDDFLLQEKTIEKEVEPLYEKPLLYQGSKKRKDEVKRFKPSPIISPIYGLLDEKGNKINDDKEVVDMVLNNKDEVSLDDVRKKAYGKLDDEIEDTLKKLSSKTIEEAEKEEKVEELSREEKKEKKKKEKTKKEIDFDEDDDEMILPSVSFKEIDVDSKTKKEETDDDDDEETKEQDLFNLIDSMYMKDGEE